LITAWSKGTEPKNPIDPQNPWDSQSDNEQVAQQFCRHTAGATIAVGDPPTPTNRGGVLLVPKILLLPPGASLPTGLVINPATVSYENFLAILDEASGTPDRKPSHWLDTPLTRIWFEAAAANPTTMASNQFTALDFHAVTAHAPTQDAAALYLHLKEHIRSQAMWDHSFYKADSAVLPKVLQFGKWCRRTCLSRVRIRVSLQFELQ
jgi:hypothetical protein